MTPLLREAAQPTQQPTDAGPVFGRLVSYRINMEGEHRPAIVLRDDPGGLATLFVFTLPGDQIAAGARVSMQRAVSRPRGDSVGQWQPLT